MKVIQNWVRAALIIAGLSWGANAIGNEDLRSKQVREQWSGWWYVSSEADVNGDLGGGATGISAGSGSFGRFTGGGSSDIAPWDGVSFCDFDEAGNPIAVQVYYVSLSNVQRYSNGDLVYTQLAGSPPSGLCFNFLTNTSRFDLHLDVVGGTGSFEGATGEVAVSGSSVDFLTGMGSQYGSTTGVIYGVRSDRHDRSGEED